MTTSERKTEVAVEQITAPVLRDMRGPLQLEEVPQRRKVDQEVPVKCASDKREVLSFERIRDIVSGLNAGPDMAYRVARAVEEAVLEQIGEQTQELLEVVRTVAMMSHEMNFRPRPTKENPRAMPLSPGHVFYHSSPLVQVARKLCERNGLGADGQPAYGRVHNPEDILLARERGDRDFHHTYLWLLGEAKRAGFQSIHAAILAAQPEKK